MTECKPVSTPLEVGKKLSLFMCSSNVEENEMMKNVLYQMAIRSLLYAAQSTRPDIAFAVGALSKFNSNPGPEHWTALKRIFRYLQGTKNMKLIYSSGKDSRIDGYFDADYADDRDDKNSTSGYIFKFGVCCALSCNTRRSVVASNY
ncbi:uncharacterized protein [Leptinotarsa decemlineata]|uniref:uncharacterized protein n=1 Tax=Leptinotarsa decemlineata TaxID=7539 RepID=UPI003D309AE7